jgi:hypothetical protein
MSTIFILSFRGETGKKTLLASPDKDSIYRHVHHSVLDKAVEKAPKITLNAIIESFNSSGKYIVDSKNMYYYRIIECEYFEHGFESYGETDLHDLMKNNGKKGIFNSKIVQKQVDEWNIQEINYTFDGKPVKDIVKNIIKKTKSKDEWKEGISSIIYCGKFMHYIKGPLPKMPCVTIDQS